MKKCKVRRSKITEFDSFKSLTSLNHENEQIKIKFSQHLSNPNKLHRQNHVLTDFTTFFTS
jgi:hypothetical protein